MDDMLDKNDIDVLTEEENKKIKGQFFTITNPFNINIFYKWLKLIPEDCRQLFLEPFAGSNNIVKMIEDLDIVGQWDCYDLETSDVNASPKNKIHKCDTLANFPINHHVAITNPPYLAKNSATRSKMNFPECEFDDLYKLSVYIMLQNLDYVAAIIPESFINANLFHDRLYAFVSLTCKMFDDTDCPVCLALFIPENQKKDIVPHLDDNDFFVYRQNKKLGTYQQLEANKPSPKISVVWRFNDKEGNIGIRCIDGTVSPSIEFIRGEEIDKDKIKISSRSLTRVSGLPIDIDLNLFLKKCNKKLIEYRENTSDIFLTSFKGLRKDNFYRRRLDFANAKVIMNSVVEDIRREGNP